MKKRKFSQNMLYLLNKKIVNCNNYNKNYKTEQIKNLWIMIKFVKISINSNYKKD